MTKRNSLGDMLLAIAVIGLLSCLHDQSYSFYADAPEVSLLAINIGYAHPPGFMVSQLLLRLLFQVNVWFNLNLSGYQIAHGLSQAFSVLVLWTLLRIQRIYRVDILSRLLLLLAVVTNYIFIFCAWLPEYFMILTALTLLIIYLWTAQEKYPDKEQNLKSISLLSGVAVAQHQYVLVFLIPFYLLLFAKKTWLQRVQIFLCACAAYFFLLIMNLILWHEQYAVIMPSFLWGNFWELEGIFNYLLRRDYGTFQLLNVSEVRNWSNHYSSILRLTQAWLLLPLLVFRKDLTKNLAIKLGTVCLLGFTLFALNIPYQQGSDLFLIDRFLLLPFVLILILLAIGLNQQLRILRWCLLLIVVVSQAFILPEKIAAYNVKTLNELLKKNAEIFHEDDWLVTNSEALGLGLKYYAYYKGKNLNLVYESFCARDWYQKNLRFIDLEKRQRINEFLCAGISKKSLSVNGVYATYDTRFGILDSTNRNLDHRSQIKYCSNGLLIDLSKIEPNCEEFAGQKWDRIEDPMGNKFILSLLNRIK